METKLKIDKKSGTFKLSLPENDTCVIICTNKASGLVPICIESSTNIKVDFIKKLLTDPEVTQITLIPINYSEYIHVLKEWRPVKSEILKEFQER